MIKSILLIYYFFCIHGSFAQIMNVQTTSGVTHFNLSDIISISFADENVAETVTDVDGNTYTTVKIGNQVWMAENLRVTHYRNGDAIPNISDKNQWASLTSGACCYYNNNLSILKIYGRLYNFYAVNDGRNIAPSGWHVCTSEEWKILENYLGGYLIAGGKMKEVGFAHWNSPNEGATNESGFSALPGGARGGIEGGFGGLGEAAFFWTSTLASATWAIFNGPRYDNIICDGSDFPLGNGLSVRCIKDK